MSKQLIRKHMGEMPLLQTMIQNLRFREVLQSYVKSHGNETIPAVDTLLLMVCNITCGRQPLYELPEWIDRLEQRSLGKVDTGGCLFSDDRFGRALDKLFGADRASLVIDVVLRVIAAPGVDLSRMPTALHHGENHRTDVTKEYHRLTIQTRPQQGSSPRLKANRL